MVDKTHLPILPRRLLCPRGKSSPCPQGVEGHRESKRAAVEAAGAVSCPAEPLLPTGQPQAWVAGCGAACSPRLAWACPRFHPEPRFSAWSKGPRGPRGRAVLGDPGLCLNQRWTRVGLSGRLLSKTPEGAGPARGPWEAPPGTGPADGPRSALPVPGPSGQWQAGPCVGPQAS